MRSSRSAATRGYLLGLLLAASSPALASGAATGSPLEPTLLEVVVNGQGSDEPLLLQHDSSGGLYASEEQLREWRIRLPSTAPITIDGEAWYRIDNDPGLHATLSAAEQSLRIDARPELFERQSASLSELASIEMTPSGTGGWLNYDLLTEYRRGDLSFSGAIEAGAFTRFGVGSSGFVLSSSGGRARMLRLETGWSIDRPESLTSIRIGDAVTTGGTGVAPLRFGGIQYARNFATRPGYLTMPLPTLEGSATVPSVVDVYVNNTLQGSREVTPGPFELTNVPIQSGGGTVQLVTRDLLGRQVVTQQSYYASSVLLRRGLHDFSYEIGFVRSGFGARSNDYGGLVASTSHRYGLSDAVTLEAHAQASRATQVAGAGVNLSFFDLGTIGAAAAVSRSPRGSGALLSGSIERRSTGLSFGVHAEYASANYTFLGIGADNRPPRLSAQAFADLPLLGGSVGLNFIRRDRRGGEQDESVAGAFANVPLVDGMTMQVFARRAVAGSAQTVLGAHVSFSLGGRRNASASVEYRAGGGFSHNVSFQEDAPTGVGGGYRATANVSDGRRTLESVYSYSTTLATLSTHVSRAGGATGVRLSARGSLGLLGGRPFAARSLGGSFARVQVGGHAGVRVYADNQLIGVTGADGSVVVPALRPFDRNVIRIEEADLPLEVQIGETEMPVRPFARAGAVLRFGVRRERGVLLQLSLEDGTPLPAGALVRVDGAADLHVAVSGGEVYIPALDGSAVLEASWSAGNCRLAVTVPETDDPQPRLAGLICRRTETIALR
ncbi:MAG TPA: fimbria/pilus outer membrane usher protein [Allosphingosinicella sp.]|nr:fimbria/pilus outer membrane usher protein [Allosphingosinicella sp.]